jgi:hypothetical protein
MTNAQKTCSYLCHKQVDIYSMTITQEALSLQKMTFCYLQKYCKNIFATCTEPPKKIQNKVHYRIILESSLQPQYDN